jgi:hypothetical protein
MTGKRPYTTLGIDELPPNKDDARVLIDRFWLALHHRKDGIDLLPDASKNMCNSRWRISDAPEKLTTTRPPLKLLALDNGVKTLASLSLHARPTDQRGEVVSPIVSFTR